MKEQEEAVSEETRIYRRETATLLGLVEDDVLLGPADVPSPKPAA